VFSDSLCRTRNFNVLGVYALAAQCLLYRDGDQGQTLY
jgi:hypothetical protein